MGVPRLRPVKSVLLNSSDQEAKPRPRVTTARFTPRVRSAGRPKTKPTTTAVATPSGTAASKGQPWLDTSRPAAKAPTPPSANWARDSCPAYPVTTTTLRAIMAADIELTRATFQSVGRTVAASTARTAASPSAYRGERTAAPTAGRRSAVLPRTGSPWPRTTSTSTMTRKGTASETPVVCT